MSNETKFTEGDWFADDSCYGSPFIDDGSGGVLAEVYDVNNAHLIAAAPEMYKILDFIYKELNGVEESIYWDDIEKLLSKARGEA